MKRLIRFRIVLLAGVVVAIVASVNGSPKVSAQNRCAIGAVCWNSGMSFNGQCGDGALAGGSCDCVSPIQDGGPCLGQ